ncbi:MAG: hypothetical protein RMI94_11650 [Bryobacterales bacterium]|nr:hypothetical protein [Bryobacteraceae bacterium]MDW8131197.1 hypothetical protein [Bryobacterales bacterium]
MTAALLALLAVIAPADRPRAIRASLAALERLFDARIERQAIEDPLLLLGTTRGVYLEGYGAVLTAEVNLVAAPGLSPFRPALTKEEIARLNARKQQRLPQLKQIMREMLQDAAAALEALPPNEQIVLAITLFHYSWEDRTGLPGQILMQAQRQQLLAVRGRSAEALAGAITVKEY